MCNPFDSHFMLSIACNGVSKRIHKPAVMWAFQKLQRTIHFTIHITKSSSKSRQGLPSAMAVVFHAIEHGACGCRRRSRMVTVEAPAIDQQPQPPSLPLAGSIPMPSNEVPALTSGAILTPSPGIPPEVLSSRLGRSQAVVAQSPAHSVSRLAAPAFTAVTMDGPCMTTQHGLQQSSVQPANRSSQDDSPTRNPLHSAQQGQAPQHNPVLSVQLRHQHGAPQQAADDWVP